MHSFFIIVWHFMKRFAQCLFKANTIYFVVVNLSLWLVWECYIKCNEIPVKEDGAFISQVECRDSIVADVTVMRNYSSSYSKHLCQFVDSIDRVMDGNYNAIQLINTGKMLSHKISKNDPVTGMDYPALLNAARKNTGAYIPDSIPNMLTVNQNFQLNDWYKYYLSVLRTGLESHSNEYLICLYNGGDNKQGNTSFAECGHIVSFTDNFNGILYAGCEDQQYSYFSPFDVSQIYLKFKLESDIPITKLSFCFWGATEFSQIIPAPDMCDFQSIRYTDPSKIQLIKQKGLVFHARFADTNNIQSTRMFILTALITVLLSLWFGIGTKLALLIIAEIRHKESQNK